MDLLQLKFQLNYFSLSVFFVDPRIHEVKSGVYPDMMSLVKLKNMFLARAFNYKSKPPGTCELQKSDEEQ